MLVDGKAIAAAITAETKQAVDKNGRTPRLSVFSCDANFVTNTYLTIKQRAAEAAGIEMVVHELENDVSTEDVIEAIKHAVNRSDGVVVQMPFPAAVAIDAVLASIPDSHDVDTLNPHNEHVVLSPVVGAMEAVLATHKIRVGGLQVAVLGAGKLVGRPVAEWFKKVGALVSVVDVYTPNAGEILKTADVIASGIGQPGFIKPTMLKEGVVILDAGTSELGGKLAGDADPACAAVASLLTPVPGGIGPITVAVLMRNVVTLARAADTKKSVD